MLLRVRLREPRATAKRGAPRLPACRKNQGIP